MKPHDYRPDVRIERRDAIAYLEQERPGYGVIFDALLTRLVREICQNPKMFPKKRNGARYCCMGLFKYNIWFFEKEEDVVILAVAHTRRKPGYWRCRLSEVR